jgi:hypothetical protein
MIYTDIKIVRAKTIEPYKIELEFNDGKIQIVDLEGVLYGTIYGPLRNPDLFKELRLNTEIATIEWPNGADFHPETLYNWEKHKEVLFNKAKKWQQLKTA